MGLNDFNEQEDHRHPRLWFDDGNVLVKLEDGRMCKIHQALLDRSSPKKRDPTSSFPAGTDTEVLLEHLYGIRYVL